MLPNSYYFFYQISPTGSHGPSTKGFFSSVMQKPTPPVLDIVPTLFASKVDHLRHMFAFLPNQKFQEIILLYLPDFVFEKHGPDIERALAIITTVDERVLLIDTL
eukprot:TRINITY_DN6487_c1_g6_i1.p3 TRINITY_DN6487_c1_g6~~TRINITY_DN6487_c1_g6_i1.p3  ORF type:complete len:105 (-),score=14.57 TRINITY_DN6487_c1_g6_i1:443-757(-)